MPSAWQFRANSLHPAYREACVQIPLVSSGNLGGLPSASEGHPYG
jgi:hypothetical protein